MYNHLLAAVIVYPDCSTVPSLYFEPVIRADGAQKNGCKRYAAGRNFESVQCSILNAVLWGPKML